MKIYLVEDDEDLTYTISVALDIQGVDTEVFESAESFLQAYTADFTGCILLDVNLPGISGIDLQKELINRGCWLPIVFITGYGEIPDAVETVRMGAVDYIEKPFKMDALMKVLEKASDHIDVSHKSMERISILTSRERDVFDVLIAGLSNKLIAKELGIGLRTVEFHRKNILEKLEAISVSELVEIHRCLPNIHNNS